MLEVVEISQVEQLDAYQSAWSALLAQTDGGSFFHSLDWLKAYWRHFGQGQKLRVLAVHRGDDVIGILPLTVIAEKTRLGAMNVLTYPLHDWGSFYGPIGPSPAATLAAALRHVRQSRRDWDILDLRWTDADRHDHGRTPAAMEAVGFKAHEGVWRRLPVVDTLGSWEAYLASRSVKFRSHIRRHLRRVESSGRVEHLRYRPLGEAHGDGDPRWDLYDACVELARRSWQGSSSTGTTLSHAAVSEFLRETHALAAKAGAVDLSLLKLDGRPIAFHYNYHHEGHVSGLRLGYDPQFSHLSPGHVLYAYCVRDSFQRGDHTFDLGAGSEQAKHGWLTRIVTSRRYAYYPLAAPRAQLVRWKRWMTVGHDACVGSKA
jgi:CelD/BcsL family acetyltransferase involved in cellulose biosynthesis